MIEAETFYELEWKSFFCYTATIYQNTNNVYYFKTYSSPVRFRKADKTKATWAKRACELKAEKGKEHEKCSRENQCY